MNGIHSFVNRVYTKGISNAIGRNEKQFFYPKTVGLSGTKTLLKV